MVRDFTNKREPPPGMDRDDLIQEVLFQWVIHRERYTPSRGASIQTFFRNLARNRLEDIWREQTAAKRGGKENPLSLDEPVDHEEDDSATLVDSVASPSDVAAEAESNIECERIMGLLDSRQQALSERLAQGYSLAEAARKMGIARTTLADELTRIKRILRTHGYGPDATQDQC